MTMLAIFGWVSAGWAWYAGVVSGVRNRRINRDLARDNLKLACRIDRAKRHFRKLKSPSGSAVVMNRMLGE